MLCPFKNYSNIFGEVGKGVHQHKFMSVIIIDNLLTIAGAVFLSYFTELPFPLSIILVYTLSIIIHMLFGVKTKTLQYLGLSC